MVQDIAEREEKKTIINIDDNIYGLMKGTIFHRNTSNSDEMVCAKKESGSPTKISA